MVVYSKSRSKLWMSSFVDGNMLDNTKLYDAASSPP